MELKSFISKALTKLLEGIEEAQDQTAHSTGRINPGFIVREDMLQKRGLSLSRSGEAVDFVDFDVAVIATDAKGAKGGGSISVMGLEVGGGGSAEASTQSNSRIRFRIPVAMPVAKKGSDTDDT